MKVTPITSRSSQKSVAIIYVYYIFSLEIVIPLKWGTRMFFRKKTDTNAISTEIPYNLCITALFWLFVVWFFFAEKQKHEIEHIYCAGIRLIYNLWEWNDYVTLVLPQDKSLNVYVYDYWKKFMKSLNESPNGAVIERLVRLIWSVKIW